MKTDLLWIITLIGVILICVGGVILHEKIETPQDKCIDGCLHLHNIQSVDVEKECVLGCSQVVKCNLKSEH